MLNGAATERHARGDRPSRHTPAVPAGSAGRLKSSLSVSNAECGGHRASRTRRSAVKAHTRRADWLGWAAEEQLEREQCRTAAAIERHARGDRPSRHTHAMPTGSAGRLKSSTSASNAESARPSRRHARGDRPSRHARAVPTGSARRLKSSLSASNAVRRRPSSVTHEAIGRQGTHMPCRLARPGG